MKRLDEEKALLMGEPVVSVDEEGGDPRSVKFRYLAPLRKLSEMEMIPFSNLVNMATEILLRCFVDSETNTLSSAYKILRTKAHRLEDLEMQFHLMRLGINVAAKIVKTEELYKKLLKLSKNSGSSFEKTIIVLLKEAVDNFDHNNLVGILHAEE